jgi:hypothetical protein
VLILFDSWGNAPALDPLPAPIAIIEERSTSEKHAGVSIYHAGLPGSKPTQIDHDARRHSLMRWSIAAQPRIRHSRTTRDPETSHPRATNYGPVDQRNRKAGRREGFGLEIGINNQNRISDLPVFPLPVFFSDRFNASMIKKTSIEICE